MTPWLGVVADDLTGACDLADAVSDAGSSAIVFLGTPALSAPGCDCAVVALKSRTAPVAEAVAASVAAARWLLDAGCDTLYQKYCSTFDSTDEGNIGPVADALAGLLGGVTVGTPATPRVGRTVYNGHLFVGRRLLSDSPLRDHPLTPMRDPDLVRVLGRQAAGAVASIGWPTVAAGPAAVAGALEAVGRGHVIVDALTEGDLDTLAAALLRADRRMVGGAAGLAAALARVRTGGTGAARAVPSVPDGRRLILSGSCSARTREQVAAFDGPLVPLSPLDLAADFDGTVERVLAAIGRAGDGPVLVTSSADPDRVRDAEARLGPGRAAGLLERATAGIAVGAVGTLGVRRLLVAGGETSGAVVGALGVDALRVGPAAGPGLPWMVPDSGPRLALLLKSGNFGEPDLFGTAWAHISA
ncbi:3-oxo-tetronate kinase [Virgisporangium ochraceum]|uniref:3-oxo-tetronate kinase n=1 Tax=Virgisporangium ochraceum TaxID=65505 RepID=A0A8J4A3M2_9ACTN|nr:3-oxo-tetronate kinase [Virgisporangium ochraceum]GIJ73927.1 HPr kinase [Virgisporangium ochraceum]